jgi:hypothetical protein
LCLAPGPDFRRIFEEIWGCESLRNVLPALPPGCDGNDLDNADSHRGATKIPLTGFGPIGSSPAASGCPRRKLAVVLHRMLADGTSFLAEKAAVAAVR